MDIGKKNFCELDNMEDEGLVFLGAGGNLYDWIDGVSADLVSSGIARMPVVREAFVVQGNVAGDQGRTDLVMLFHPGIDYGKLAVWRIAFGSASWISDFTTNYRHNYIETMIGKED